ncbi:MAG: dipeptidase [Verrucomicrobia bacterium]|nr:dipeptidase [Verrucomicrobiota bacterium]
MSLDLSNLKKWYERHREAILDDFITFLAFKSISADSAFDDETKLCANWLADYLKRIGLEVELWPTSGQPVIFAKHCKAGKERPTLLVYQHYDVQPVDPLDLWKSEPFKAAVRDGKVFARGAQDNKGQCFYTVTAMRALFELCEKLNFNLKLFIEGEEESGSTGTREVFAKKGKELESDYLLVVDSGIPAQGQPAITLGLRGILTMEIVCRAAAGDLHSGSFGGIAYNPNRALATALASLYDEEGRVAVAHFYDDVAELTKKELEQFHLEIDEERVKKEHGLRALCPEPGFSIGQSATIRPTLEINGMGGGYTGEGFKTVLPAVATAKISCRLVPNQDPAKIAANLKAHLLDHLPKGLETKISVDQGSPAFRGKHDSVIAKLVAKAYEEVLGKPCQYILIGGSIPITVELARASQAETVMMGYGLDTDQIHAPNEHFGLDRFEQGFLTMGRIFGKLNEQ